MLQDSCQYGSCGLLEIFGNELTSFAAVSATMECMVTGSCWSMSKEDSRLRDGWGGEDSGNLGDESADPSSPPAAAAAAAAGCFRTSSTSITVLGNGFSSSSCIWEDKTLMEKPVREKLKIHPRDKTYKNPTVHYATATSLLEKASFHFSSPSIQASIFA